MRVSMNALRSVDRSGGLDAFLLNADDSELSVKALRIKRQIAKKQAKKEEIEAAEDEEAFDY